MAEISVEVRNLERLTSKIQRTAIQNAQGLDRALMLGGAEVSNEAKRRVVYDTSRLKASIHAQPAGKHRVKVGTGVRYAPFVEFGFGTLGESTYRQPNGKTFTFSSKRGKEARPFLYPALRATRHKVNSIIKKEVIRSLKGGR